MLKDLSLIIVEYVGMDFILDNYKINFYEENMNNIRKDVLYTNLELPLSFFNKHNIQINIKNINIPIIYILENFEIYKYDLILLCKRIDMNSYIINKYKLIEKDPGLLFVISANPFIDHKNVINSKYMEDVVFIFDKNETNPEYLNHPKYKEKLKIKQIIKKDWYDKSKELSLDEIEKKIDNIDWNSVYLNPNINDKWVEDQIKKQGIDNVHWYNISKNPSLSVDFFNKYKHKIVWIYIGGNHSIPLYYKKKNLINVINEI